MLLFYFLLFHDEAFLPNANRILGSSGLLVTLYRSFSHLRVLDPFTFLVGMINTIVLKLLTFFFILAYFCVATGLLVMKLRPQEHLISSLSNAYVWTLFGGIEGDDFHAFDFAGIPIFFGTIMVTVVLLNLLIAYLSNLFSRLED